MLLSYPRHSLPINKNIIVFTCAYVLIRDSAYSILSFFISIEYLTSKFPDVLPTPPIVAESNGCIPNGIFALILYCIPCSAKIFVTLCISEALIFDSSVEYLNNIIFLSVCCSYKYFYCVWGHARNLDRCRCERSSARHSISRRWIICYPAPSCRIIK